MVNCTSSRSANKKFMVFRLLVNKSNKAENVCDGGIPQQAVCSVVHAIRNIEFSFLNGFKLIYPTTVLCSLALQ